MERIILSLKNLYNILKKDDFPVYSVSVLGKSEKKGMTMQGFWQRYLIEEFRCEQTGRMLWRNDGKRNRYTSHLCNRSEELKNHKQYARELASHISEKTLLEQIRNFEEFFAEKEYKHDMFLYRIQELMRLCALEDSCIGSEIIDQAKEVLNGSKVFRRYGSDEKLFQAAYLMTILMLYAAAGNSMMIPELAGLRRKEYGLDALWKKSGSNRQKQESEKISTEILTEHVAILQDNYLPEWRFFGREEELYDLKEMVVNGQKCLISGMGGIGKTELLRQLIRLCQKQSLADKLAIVACDNDFENCMFKSFRRYQCGAELEADERYRQLVQRIRWDAEHGKVLILLDDYVSSKENDEKLQQLLELPCSLLVTARQTELKGLESYRLSLPAVSTGTLIFRDNYENHLNRNDRLVLESLLADESICHPLTLRLMARAARCRNWTVEELKVQMEKKRSEVSWNEADSVVRLGQFYRQLYSFVKIQKDCREVAELFSVLPRDSYSEEFLGEWFPQICSKALAEKLVILKNGGWLDADDEGVSMHPLIAECLRKKVLTEKQMEPLLGHICDAVIGSKYGCDSSQEAMEFQKATRVLVHIASYLTGNVSKKLLLAVLMAVSAAGVQKRSECTSIHVINRLLKNCHERDDEIEVAYQTALCQMNRADEEVLIKIYRSQMEKRTVPEWLFSFFCVYAGVVLFEKKHSNAAEMLENALNGTLSLVWKAECYYWLSSQYEYMGNSEMALKCAEEGCEFVRLHLELMKEKYVPALGRLCTMYIAYQKKEMAERILAEMKEHFTADTDEMVKFDFLTVQALYELNFGSLETALSFYKEGLALLEPYMSLESTRFAVRMQIGTILLRLKRCEEALEIYFLLLESVDEEEGGYLLHILNNNVSVAYLELGQPERALEHLHAAYSYAESSGGYALGEVCRNYARAYRQLGNEEVELEWVKRASLLLDASYGPEHPRSMEMRERLAELEREKKNNV